MGCNDFIQLTIQMFILKPTTYLAIHGFLYFQKRLSPVYSKTSITKLSLYNAVEVLAFTTALIKFIPALPVVSNFNMICKESPGNVILSLTSYPVQLQSGFTYSINNGLLPVLYKTYRAVTFSPVLTAFNLTTLFLIRTSVNGSCLQKVSSTTRLSNFVTTSSFLDINFQKKKKLQTTAINPTLTHTNFLLIT